MTDFLTQATTDILKNNERSDILINNNERKQLQRFIEMFQRLPQEFQDGLIKQAQEELDEEDRKKKEKEDKQAEQLARSSKVLTNSRALGMKERLRQKLLEKKGLIINKGKK